MPAPAKQHADVLVLGHSLEAALAATRLVKDGWRVLWPGTPPRPREKVGTDTVAVAPGLAPALAQAPALARALAELGLEAAAKKLLRPVGVQLLDDGRRLEVQAQQLALLREPAEALHALTKEHLDSGYFGRRRARLADEAVARLASPEGVGGELARAVAGVLATGDADRSAWALACAPHLLDGGLPALVGLFHQRFGELGGWSLPGGLDRPLKALELSLGGVRATLADGEVQAARLLVVGLDATAAPLVLPEGERRLTARLSQEAEPLWRLSLVVRSRGLPVALGPVAFVGGDLLVERRPVEAGRELLNLFWRDGGGSPDAQAERALERLRPVLPFFERHLVARAGPARVAGHDRLPAPRLVRPRWRALQALGPQPGAWGLDGAARLGEAIARRARQLAPRQELLKKQRFSG